MAFADFERMVRGSGRTTALSCGAFRREVTGQFVGAIAPRSNKVLDWLRRLREPVRVGL